MDKDRMTVKQAAEKLLVSVRTIRNWCARGVLDATRTSTLGGKVSWSISRASVEARIRDLNPTITF